MTKHLRTPVLAVLFFGLAVSPAYPQGDTCRFVEWSFGYIKVERSGEALTYSLTTSGPRWHSTPYGYHAPGLLSCDSCAKAGLYYLAVESSSYKRPATAAERVDRSKENFFYPPISVGPKQLQHRATREAVSIGPLSGYAVFYRFANLPAPYAPPPREGNLLVISLTDGCVSFETSIAGEARSDEADWAVLDSLVAEIEISISRTSANDIAGGRVAVVRSRRDGEKPVLPRGGVPYSAIIRARPQ